MKCEAGFHKGITFNPENPKGKKKNGIWGVLHDGNEGYYQKH